MTRNEILALAPRAADYLACEKVLGWKRFEKITSGSVAIEDAWLFRHPDNGWTVIPVEPATPHFSNKANAYILVDAMLRRGFVCLMRRLPDLPDGTEQWRGGWSTDESFADDETVTLPTLQDALLRSALIAVGA